MNRKALIVLAVAAALALIGAIALHLSRKPASETDGAAALQGGPLAPGLREHVNDVDRLVVTGAGGKVLATITRGASGWSVEEKGGHPADTGKLRSLLLRLADAERVERKTANPERYAQLGVEDVAAADAKGVQLDIGGLGAPLQIIVGNASARGGGSFVRLAGAPESWLVSQAITIEKDPANWLARDLADIGGDRIASVTLTGPDGKTVRVAKENEGDANFMLADVPKGREPASEYTINGLASTLAGLRLEDVMPAAQAEPPADARKARYEGFDGIVVDAIAWEKEGKRYARFAASVDDAAAERHVERAQANEKAVHDAAKAEGAAESASAPVDATDATQSAAVDADAPLSVTDPAKDRERRLAAVRAEADALQKRFDGWTFVIPAYKYESIAKSQEDLLKPAETGKSAAKKK